MRRTVYNLPGDVQLPSRVLEVELTLVSSNHHVEMNPSDVGNNDRYVVQEILKVFLCLSQSPPDADIAHIHRWQMHDHDHAFCAVVLFACTHPASHLSCLSRV